MKLTVTKTWNYTIQRADDEACDRLGIPKGTFEILDEDGDRYCFAETENKAMDDLREMHGHDSDVYGGEVKLVPEEEQEAYTGPMEPRSRFLYREVYRKGQPQTLTNPQEVVGAWHPAHNLILTEHPKIALDGLDKRELPIFDCYDNLEKWLHLNDLGCDGAVTNQKRWVNARGWV